MDERARAFLEGRRVAHLATADARGVPHVVPVCFVVVGNAIYVALDEKPKALADPRLLKRVRNLEENPSVALVCDVYDDDWAKLGFVLVRGRGRVVEPRCAEHVSAVEALRGKYAQYREMALEERPVIALDIARVTAWGVAGADGEK